MEKVWTQNKPLATLGSVAVKKTEVTCVRCGWTKLMTQKAWDGHMLKIHNFRNETQLAMFAPKEDVVELKPVERTHRFG